jgi:hypothetical protein
MVTASAVMLVAGNMPSGLFILDSVAIMLMAGCSGDGPTGAVCRYCRGKARLQCGQHKLFPHVFAADVKQTNANVNAPPHK